MLLLLFLLMMLGLVLLLFCVFDVGMLCLLCFVFVFGKVLLFFYVLYFYLIYLLVVGVCYVGYGYVGGMFFLLDLGYFLFIVLLGWGLDLLWIYVIWIGVVLVLYLLCCVYVNLKWWCKDWWFSYF